MKLIVESIDTETKTMTLRAPAGEDASSAIKPGAVVAFFGNRVYTLGEIWPPADLVTWSKP